MIYNDIINPLLNDFLTRVTGFGGQFFKSSSITRLNDFVNYLSELTYPNFDFAFYPLRQDQNIGAGKYVFGIGNLATGTNIFFRNNVNWTQDGIYLNSVQNCGEIDFSGRVVGDFQFRKNDASVFYFLKHTRDSFPISFYRPNIDQVPYFCFDYSTDHFSVTAPNFSKNRFRQRGTTYIYDEIYGEDKKGLQIDWTEKPSEKFYLPQSFSFYQMDKDIPSGQFICLNANITFDNYTLKSIYGKDPATLTGAFLPPYSSRPLGFPETRSNTVYFFPRRMVIGAGVSNMAETYDVDGIDHICAGVLIFRGNYYHKADEIARKMAEGVGIINETFQPYIADTDRANLDASINSIKHILTTPKPIPPYKSTSSITAKIKSIFLRFIGTLNFEKYNWGAWGTSSVEWAYVDGNLSGRQLTGIVDYKYPILGSTNKNPITGFISGFLSQNGEKTFFPPGSISGKSGYFTRNNLGDLERNFFPPYKTIINENIIGFISGNYDDYGNFKRIENDLFVSGYFLEGNKFYLNPNTGTSIENIIGFISGVLDAQNNFSPFHESNINQRSGYLENGQQKQFAPFKYVSGTEPVIGYIKGELFNNTFYPLTESLTSQEDISGYFYKNQQISFPRSTGGFDGFNNMPYFYPELGYEYSGFFVGSSGLLIKPGESTGYATGFIGSKAAIYSSGNFSEFNNIDKLDNRYNYKFSGFFVGQSNFSGIDNNWPFIQADRTGILTGIIGSYETIKTLNTTINFDGKSGFNPVSGYAYSGFFVGNSFFSGITGNQFGFGAMTGIIGYRGISDQGLIPFNGFTGMPKIDVTYYSNVFVNYDNISGFVFSGIGGKTSGLGIFSGIISSGNFAGDIAKLHTSTGISSYSGYDFQISGLYYDVGVLISGLSITGYSGINSGSGPLYYTGIFHQTGLEVSGQSGLSYFSGHFKINANLTGIKYSDGIYDIVAGSGGVSGESQFISGEYPPVIGFLSGYMDQSGRFSGFNIIAPEKNSYGYFVSGIQYFLPTGEYFSGFQYIDYLNTSAGFKFSGFFASHIRTGYVGPQPGSGILTGYIGIRQFYISSASSGAICTGASGESIWCPENAYFSGGITGYVYKTGFIDVVIETGFTGFLGFSGMSGFSGLAPDISLVFPSGDFASGSFDIKSIDYFVGQFYEIYPYIRAVSGFTITEAGVSIGGYFEDMPDFGWNNNARITTTISSARYYNLNNEFIFADSGVQYGPSPFSLSSDPLPSYFDNLDYKPIAVLLTGIFPTVITPPSISAISDIEGLTEDPYFDNVVLLLNMSGRNLSTDLVDSSKFHHRVVAALNTASMYSYSGFYNIFGAENVNSPFSTESGIYELSSLNTEAYFAIESGIYQLSGLNDAMINITETSMYSITGFENINPITGYNYLIESGNYQVSAFQTVNPITGYGYLQESGNYTVSVSGTINSYESLLSVSIYPFSETGASFGASGNININYDTFRTAETGGLFGLSGNSMVNYDVFRITETGAQFGVSGVILITGQF